MESRQLTKSTIAGHFRFGCSRFTRFQIATSEERKMFRLDSDPFRRPGHGLVVRAGRCWERERYEELLAALPAVSVHCQRDARTGNFAKIINLVEALRSEKPPTLIFEAEFEVPDNITSRLPELCKRKGLQFGRVRPDLLWLKCVGTVIEIHIVDVKMASEPSLRHRVEVAFYALALGCLLERNGLADRYRVADTGFLWAGGYHPGTFADRYRALAAEGGAETLAAAFSEIFVAIPLENYTAHLRRFFDRTLVELLSQEPLEVGWHVNPSCQGCVYLGRCLPEARVASHLSLVPGLSSAQADHLRLQGLGSVAALASQVATAPALWQAAISEHHQLRARAPALEARVTALTTRAIQPVIGRRTSAMPNWTDMAVHLSLHFDPGSGITFALAARCVYYPLERVRGSKPEIEERAFVVERRDSEREVVLAFAAVVGGWMRQAAAETTRRDACKAGGGSGPSLQFFFWDELEIRHLRSVLGRYRHDTEFAATASEVLSMFPPEDVLPEPELFCTQPATIVKRVVQQLIGLPLECDYGLLDTANVLYPALDAEGKPRFVRKHAYGFSSPLSDQIPYERAYELWSGQVELRRYDPALGEERPFTRNEVIKSLTESLCLRVRALGSIVGRVQQHHGGQLSMRKRAFRLTMPRKTSLPEPSRKLLIHHQLNTAVRDSEVRHTQGLPVHEREASYRAIRGLRLASGPTMEAFVHEIRLTRSRYSKADVSVYSFADSSRETRLRAGDFLVALSNEDSSFDLEAPWRVHLKLSYKAAVEKLHEAGFDDRTAGRVATRPLSDLLRVTIVALQQQTSPPMVMLLPADERLFAFAQVMGLYCQDRPGVLDTIYRDYETAKIESVLHAIGSPTVPPLLPSLNYACL